MSNLFHIDNMSDALKKRQFPTITLWNRLEARPRRQDFDRALKAEIRDALWMLTRQWQMGEFKGDDAGSAAFAKIHIATTRLNKYQADQHPAQSFEDEVPLEAKVEQRAIAFHIGGQKISLDLRLQMGRQWLKMVRKVGNFDQAYIDRYPIELPDPNTDNGAAVYAHPEVFSQYSAVAGRAMDGAALYFYLKGDPTRHAWEDIPALPHQQSEIDTVATKFINWFEKLYFQPAETDRDAWRPPYLEYQFFCSAPEQQGEWVFAADEYYHGHLDWYNLDVDSGRAGLGDVQSGLAADPRATTTESFIPAPLIFEGMPNTRWWTFEDNRTNFGDIDPDTTDLAKLLLIEFGIIYANDWFLFPLTLPAGSITSVKGLAITNVFGERFWIEHVSSRLEENQQHWTMFSLDEKNQPGNPTDLNLLLPTVHKIQEGAPREEVNLVRDEIANMVWGIERIVPMADGSSKSGDEAAIETHNYLQKVIEKGIEDGLITVTQVDYKAPIRYQVMNTVPRNWIPFIPVHLDGNNREIQLQRAAMPQLIEGDPDPPEKICPRTVLIREGLDKQPAQSYFVHEEEIPRSGVIVSQSFQRTRWYNGHVFVWLGVRKQAGRGEGSSGLAFDQIIPVTNTE